VLTTKSIAPPPSSPMVALVLRHHLGELRVDDQRAGVADGQYDVAADAEQHVELVGDLLGPDGGGSQLLI
jgi:hypothetical protein